MLPSIAAAAAARALGYRGLGNLIEAEQLSPQRIATVFRTSASRSAARDCTIELLAGALGQLPRPSTRLEHAPPSIYYSDLDGVPLAYSSRIFPNVANPIRSADCIGRRRGDRYN